jgi:hypothetical protein
VQLLNQEVDVHEIFKRVIEYFSQKHEIPDAYFRVVIKAKDPKLSIRWHQEQRSVTITLPNLVYLGRCLSHLWDLDLAHNDYFEEKVIFPEVAFSLDLSRNAVMKVATVKQFIMYLVVMGYTHLYLYLEDTYLVSSEPYHGYLRGSYSRNDLKEIIDYAAIFQIEVIPCIQTLAHLDQLLKWSSYDGVCEDQSTLLVDEPKTYLTIEQWLRELRAIFTTRRIHLGLDEASGVGRGRYLQHHQYQPQAELIARHINKVVAICKKLDLEPEIWSDFLYHALDQRHLPGYYPVHAKINQALAAKLPKDIAYCYWDYGERTEANYQTRLQKHHLFGPHIHFASAAHIFGNIVPNYGKSWQSAAPGLAACQKEHIEQVMLTTWGDDGQETNHLLALPVMQMFAERCYQDEVDLSLGAKRFADCIQAGIFLKLWHLNHLNELPGVEPDNYWMANPSKLILWQDPLLGLFDKDLEQYQKEYKLDLTKYYLDQAQLFRTNERYSTTWCQVIEFYHCLAQVLADKSNLGLQLRQAYLKRDLAKLTELQTTTLPRLINLVVQLQQRHSQLWHQLYRANGWEVLESRYATLLSRLRTTINQIEQYQQGDHDSLWALREVRRPFEPGTPLVRLSVPNYRRIAFTGYN